MEINNVNDFANYVHKEVLMADPDNDILKIIFGDTEILIEIMESEIPIVVRRKRETVIEEDWSSLHYETRIAAELYAELLNDNLSAYELSLVAQICNVIDANPQVFEDLLRPLENDYDEFSD